jgi:hypothetical protein
MNVVDSYNSCKHRRVTLATRDYFGQELSELSWRCETCGKGFKPISLELPKKQEKAHVDHHPV